jgi:hypothetical protein
MFFRRISKDELKKAGVERQEAGGGKLPEDSDLSQFLLPLKREACTGLGVRDGGVFFLLPSASCLLPSEAEASVKHVINYG